MRHGGLARHAIGENGTERRPAFHPHVPFGGGWKFLQNYQLTGLDQIGDDKLRAVANFHTLAVHAGAAYDGDSFHLSFGIQQPQVICDLRSQFPRGRRDPIHP